VARLGVARLGIDEEWHQRWIGKRCGRILLDSHGEQNDEHSGDENPA
jgi:hypothetical protein